MKIGIVTLPLGGNFGGILQNYALQQVLVKMGHAPITFNVQTYDWLYYLKALALSIFQGLKTGEVQFPVTPTRLLRKQKKMRQFIRQYIEITDVIKKYSMNEVEKNDISAIIVGSDQVWRASYNKNINDRFLGFVTDANIRCIAYAASFGTSLWEVNELEKDKCKRNIKNFRAVSVREFEGVEICKKELDIDASFVLDPTLLVEQKDYLNLCMDIQAHDVGKKIFAYLLDLSNEKVAILQSVASRMGLELDIMSSDSKLESTLGPKEWMAKIRDARYIITDSYHGTVFSLIFNKNFCTILNSKRGLSRFSTLFKTFDLEDRFITSYSELKTFDFSSEIDYYSVNKILAKRKNESLSFLKEALQ